MSDIENHESKREESPNRWCVVGDSRLGESFVAVVPTGSNHSTFDLLCWCMPTIRHIEAEDGSVGMIVTHNERPHSFVGGDMKQQYLSQPMLVHEADIDDIDEDEDEYDLSPDAMICEVCGEVESAADGESLPLCEGPNAVLLHYMSPHEIETDQSEGSDER